MTDTDLADVKLLNGLASVHMVFGMWKTAITFLELSAWIEPENEETLRLMVRSYSEFKNYARVLECIQGLEKVIGRDALNDDDRFQKARALALMGSIDEARQILIPA